MVDAFGPIVPGWVVDAGVESTIKTWIGSYLSEISLQWGRPLLEDFKSYNVRPTGEHWIDDQIPALVIVNAGLDSPPRKSGEGEYEADFRVGLIIVAKGDVAANARANVEDYAAAVRAIMVQKHSLGIGALSVVWDAESYDEAPPESLRTLAGATVEFVITMPSLLIRTRGPDQPTTPPGTVLSQVESTFLDVTRKS